MKKIKINKRHSLEEKKISMKFYRCKTSNNAAKSLQSCPTLCNPIDSSPSSSPIPGILQARTLEWVETCTINFFLLYLAC